MWGAGCSLAAPTLAMTWSCRAQSGGRWMCSEQTSIQPDLIRHRTRMDTRAPKPRGPVLSPHPWFTGHGPENNGDVLIPRIPVPDVPGALGKVATTMGTVGADISAVPDTLVSTCDQLEGVKVLQIPCDITCNPGWIADDHPGWCDVLPCVPPCPRRPCRGSPTAPAVRRSTPSGGTPRRSHVPRAR